MVRLWTLSVATLKRTLRKVAMVDTLNRVDITCVATNKPQAPPQAYGGAPAGGYYGQQQAQPVSCC